MKMLAAGPWVNASAMVPYRAVLRKCVQSGELVTHEECVYESGRHGFIQGHYFQLHDWIGAVEDFSNRVEASICGAAGIMTDEEVQTWVDDNRKEQEL